VARQSGMAGRAIAWVCQFGEGQVARGDDAAPSAASLLAAASLLGWVLAQVALGCEVATMEAGEQNDGAIDDAASLWKVD
jgi:hypothetical protein